MLQHPNLITKKVRESVSQPSGKSRDFVGTENKNRAQAKKSQADSSISFAPGTGFHSIM